MLTPDDAGSSSERSQPDGHPMRSRTSGPRGTLKDVAYSRIKEDILSQQYPPYTPLIEADLAARYGMSKTPVREALVALAVDGLVEYTDRRSVRVAHFTIDDVREIYDLREVVEPAALRWSGPRMTQERLQQIEDVLKDAQSAGDRGEVRELSRLNREFHRLLIIDCENSRIIHLLDNLQEQLRMIALVSWSSGMSFDFEYREHIAIVDALRAGDFNDAADALAAHIRGFYSRFRSSPAAL